MIRIRPHRKTRSLPNLIFCFITDTVSVLGCKQVWKLLNGTVHCPILHNAPISRDKRWPVVVFREERRPDCFWAGWRKNQIGFFLCFDPHSFYKLDSDPDPDWKMKAIRIQVEKKMKPKYWLAKSPTLCFQFYQILYIKLMLRRYSECQCGGSGSVKFV